MADPGISGEDGEEAGEAADGRVRFLHAFGLLSTGEPIAQLASATAPAYAGPVGYLEILPRQLQAVEPVHFILFVVGLQGAGLARAALSNQQPD